MEQQNDRFSAAVLAGGLSSRMGRDKASLPFGGTTLLDFQVGKLRALGIEDIMISGSEQQIPKTRHISDVYPRKGPLGGIHACLAGAKGSAVLFLGVDTPLIPPEALQALLSAHENGVTVLRHGNRAEPLFGVYDCTLAPLCEEILRTEHTGVRQLLNRTTVKTLPFDGDETVFMNGNTPEEYARLLVLWERNGRL